MTLTIMFSKFELIFTYLVDFWPFVTIYDLQTELYENKNTIILSYNLTQELRTCKNKIEDKNEKYEVDSSVQFPTKSILQSMVFIQTTR